MIGPKGVLEIHCHGGRRSLRAPTWTRRLPSAQMHRLPFRIQRRALPDGTPAGQASGSCSPHPWRATQGGRVLGPHRPHSREH